MLIFLSGILKVICIYSHLAHGQEFSSIRVNKTIVIVIDYFKQLKKTIVWQYDYNEKRLIKKNRIKIAKVFCLVNSTWYE